LAISLARGHRGSISVDAPANRRADKSSPERLFFFQMESRVMRNRLQVSFWGNASHGRDIVAIAAALLIVIAVLAASRL
jgi:hypothetical protein